MTPLDESKRRIARHEASHLWAAYRTGRPLSSASVFSRATHGHVYLDPWLDGPLDDAAFEDRIVVNLAGWAADVTFAHEWPEEGCETDFRHARENAELVDPEHPERVLERCRARALALVRDHRAVIDRLARGLLWNLGRIAGAEVTQVLEAAINDTPIPDFYHQEKETPMHAVHIRTRRSIFEAAAELEPDASEARLAELWQLADDRAAAGETPPPFGSPVVLATRSPALGPPVIERAITPEEIERLRRREGITEREAASMEVR